MDWLSWRSGKEKVLVEIQSINIPTETHMHITCTETLSYLSYLCYPPGIKKRITDKSTQRTEGHRSLDKTLFFLFTAIPIASDRQAVAQGAQSDSNKSTLLPIYKQISLTTTNKRGAAKEEARRTAFGNH